MKINSPKKIATVPQEYLLNNDLDKNLQAFLKPLELIQLAMFQRKYRIRDNFITPNGNVVNSISFCVTFFYIIITLMNIDFFNEQGFQNDFLLHVGPQLYYFMGSIVFICLCFANVINSDNNVKLILNIQTAKRVNKHCNDGMNRLIIENRIMCGISLIFVILVAITSYLCLNYKITTVIDQVHKFHYDANIMYACRMVKLIRKSFVLWLKEMKIRMKLKSNSLIKMEVAFSNLIQAFRMYQKVFAIPVSLFDIYRTVCSFLYLYNGMNGVIVIDVNLSNMVHFVCFRF